MLDVRSWRGRGSVKMGRINQQGTFVRAYLLHVSWIASTRYPGPSSLAGIPRFVTQRRSIDRGVWFGAGGLRE
jgi:hypothetical protein